MALDRATVRRIAELARLNLSLEEERVLSEQLERILSYFARLSEVPTEGIPPATVMLARSLRFRDDRVTNVPDVEAVLDGAPDRKGNFFLVPKIID